MAKPSFANFDALELVERFFCVSRWVNSEQTLIYSIQLHIYIHLHWSLKPWKYVYWNAEVSVLLGVWGSGTSSVRMRYRKHSINIICGCSSLVMALVLPSARILSIPGSIGSPHMGLPRIVPGILDTTFYQLAACRAHSQLVLQLLCAFRVCINSYVYLWVPTYYVHNNYITYIVAMLPYLSRLRQFRWRICVATMKLWVWDEYWETEAT